MRKFDYSKLAEQTWDTDIRILVAKIHECKGGQDLFIRQKPVELDRLVETAKIQSMETSNKIEGIVTTSARMKQLFKEKITPSNREEDEITGYRDVLNTIRESNEYIPVRSTYILQLHRHLLKRAVFFYGGQFTNIQNYINETKPDGTVVHRLLHTIHQKQSRICVRTKKIRSFRDMIKILFICHGRKLTNLNISRKSSVIGAIKDIFTPILPLLIIMQ